MRFVADAEAEHWLLGLRGRVSELDWDAGNRTKNRKHGVEPEDVSALFRGDVYFAGRIVEPAHAELRWLVLGADGSGRPLAVIFTRRGDRVRPISCRPMRRKEKSLYEAAIRKEG
ncbi:BrnT family toxin [Candidatus Binatia bacterium]|nr:BrnT family toxin [Candidatus Binatia bacterium]